MVYTKLKLIVLALFLVLVALPANSFASGKGTVSGKIIDSETGEVLRRATVALTGTKLGAYSDVKGEYKLRDVPVGKYTISVSYVGYHTKKLENIEVINDQNLAYNIVLESAISRTKEVVVEARRENNNSAALLVQRKNASQVSDGISIEEIKRTPDSDAGQSLRRVSGVTLVNDKFVYVRGVSERYSNTTLNGTALASTEPDKKAFAFDMFPSEFLENANVVKSFSPDLPGNFAGGLVQLNTVEFPTSRNFKLSFGTSMSDNLTFDNKFVTYASGTRSLPSVLPSTPAAMKNLTNGLRSNDGQVLTAAQNDWEAINKSMSTKTWSRDTMSAPLNGSINMSYSDIFRIAGGDFGLIASAMYGNSYSNQDIYRATLLSNANVKGYNSGTISTFTTNLSGLFNIAYKIGNNTSFSWKNTYNNSIDDETTMMLGEKEGEYTRQYGFQYVEKTLFASQFGAEHNLEFLNNSLVDWKLGYSKSVRDEPDFKRVRYSRTDTNEAYKVDIQDLAGSGYLAGRFFSNLDENALTGAVNFTLPIDNFKIKTGFLWESKYREFKVRSLTINKGTFLMKEAYDADFGYVVTNYGDDEFYNNAFTQEPDELFGNPDNFRYDRLGYGDETKPTDSYKANEGLYAGYLMGDMPFDIAGHKLRVIAGLRVESNTQNLKSLYIIPELNRDSVFVDQNKVDLLPALNMVYELTRDMNIRMSASQTLTRPSLRELAPFTFYDYYFQMDVKGNQDLKRALIQNYDIRWEMYPNPGEAFSVSLFYKSFKDAIEETVIGSSSNYQKTFANADGTANNYGVEFEARKNLGFISDWTKYFAFNLNLALIKSEITVKQVNTIDKRAMWGQSPYSLNLGLFYYNPDLGSSVNLSYNVSGKKIIQVAYKVNYPGVDDPHIYEMPRNVVDLSLSQTVLKTIDLKFVVRDLFNENLTWKQMGKDVSRTIKGRSFSFGVSYKL